MVKLIGIVLLVFGIIGIITTLVICWWLTRPGGPIANARKLLTATVGKLQAMIILAQRAINLAIDINPLLTEAHGHLEEVNKHIINPVGETLTSILGSMAGFFREAKNLLNALKLPAFTGNEETIGGTGFEKELVVGVDWTKPAEIRETIGFYIPEIKIKTLTATSPLTDVGNTLGLIENKLISANCELEKIHNQIELIKKLTQDSNRLLADFIKEVTPILEMINNIGMLRFARNIEQSKLLTIIPLLVLGYFGLLHLAFALTGLALLLV